MIWFMKGNWEISYQTWGHRLIPALRVFFCKVGTSLGFCKENTKIVHREFNERLGSICIVQTISKMVNPKIKMLSSLMIKQVHSH